MYGMKYTAEMRQFILDNHKGIKAAELAEKFNAEFGTEIIPAQMRAYRKNHKLNSGLDGRFKKGHKSHNKGKKMPKEIYEKAKATMFQKGHVPHNHKPVGSERINADGYVEIKVAEPKKWRLKHNIVYENIFGKIPKGHVVIFLDGDKLNLDISNLKLIKRSELLIMNRYNLFQEDIELTEAATNLAKVIDTRNKVKEKSRENNG